MTKDLKSFIETNIDLIDTNNWEKLFMRAYIDILMTSEIIDLHNMLLEAGLFDSTELRNELLYEEISKNLKHVKKIHNNNVNLSMRDKMRDKYVVQFLRTYLNNTFGFTESEAVQLMYDNQNNLGIKLLPFDRVKGQTGIQNYEIVFEN